MVVWWISLLALVPATVKATLSLELTQGLTAAIPVRVQVGSGLDGDRKEAALQIKKLVEKDLSITNKLVLDQQAEPAQQVDYIAMIDKPQNEAEGDGQKKTLCVQVLDNYQSNASEVKQTCMRYEQDAYRAVAHRFSDNIYTDIIGEKSIYRQKMARVKEVVVDNENRQYALQIADFDGEAARTIMESSEPIMSPSFSPDGKKIAYVSFEGGRSSIYVQNIENGSRYILADYPGINGAPAWSPSGQEIALVLSISGVAKLYEMNLASKELTKLTSGWYTDTEPVYTKDGQSILFTSSRSGSPQIHKYNRKTKEVEQVTSEGIYNVSASISSQGDWVVYLSRLAAKLQVVTMDLDNKQVQWIGSGQYDDTPKIAPQGEFVLYATTKGRQGILELLSKDGSTRVQMIEHGANLKHPAWAPDGSDI